MTLNSLSSDIGIVVGLVPKNPSDQHEWYPKKEWWIFLSTVTRNDPSLLVWFVYIMILNSMSSDSGIVVGLVSKNPSD